MSSTDSPSPSVPVKIESEADPQTNLLRKVRVSVCSSAENFNVQGFIRALMLRFTKSLIENLEYVRLPYNNIEDFSFRGTNVDVMILCHSIHNRRFAITDVNDALYNEFLANAKKALGREKICVVVHDMPWEKLDEAAEYLDQMDAFRHQQPSTFQCASLAIIAGKLDGPEDKVELREGSWEDLKRFLKRAGMGAATLPPSQGQLIATMSNKKKIGVSIGIILAIILILVVVLSVVLTRDK